MNLLKLTAVGLIALLASCNAAKNTSENVTTTKTQEEITAMDAKFKNEGYTVGTVTLTNNKTCGVIIEVAKTGVKFDPINMNDKRFSMSKIEGEIIYFKYRPLRMMNRCDEGQPIELEDIKKREN